MTTIKDEAWESYGGARRCTDCREYLGGGER